MSIAAEPVRKQVVVGATVERAFRLFTLEIGQWWRGHPTAPPLRGAVLEARPNGRWYNVLGSGEEYELGRVLACEAPFRLLLGMFQLMHTGRPDPVLETEVELTFRDAGQEQTLVQLEHRRLERYGSAVPEVRGHLDAIIGWQATLNDFADAVGGGVSREERAL